MDSISGMRLALYVWGLLVTTLTCGLTCRTVWSIYHHTRSSEPTQMTRARSTSASLSSSSRSIRKMITKKPSFIHRTLILTAMCSISMSISMICWFSVYNVVMYRLYWNPKRGQNNNYKYDRKLEQRVSENVFPYFGLASAFQIAGLLMLILVLYSRLLFAFDNTPFMLSERESTIVTSAITAGMLCLFAGFILYYTVGPLIGTLLIFPMLIQYPITSCWLVWQFLSKTRSLCESIDLSNQGSLDLLNTALKLTILTITSVSSTLLMLLGFILRIIFVSRIVPGLIFSVIWTLDTVINVFSLLCTLKWSSLYYSFVFGSLHEWCLKRIRSQSSS